MLASILIILVREVAPVIILSAPYGTCKAFASILSNSSFALPPSAWLLRYILSVPFLSSLQSLRPEPGTTLTVSTYAIALPFALRLDALNGVITSPLLGYPKGSLCTYAYNKSITQQDKFAYLRLHKITNDFILFVAYGTGEMAERLKALAC